MYHSVSRNHIASYSPLNVTLVGHSQTPKQYDNFNNNHLNIYKKGGATLWDLDRPESPLYPALRTRCDVFILLLGGNDLFLLPNPGIPVFINKNIVKDKLYNTIIRAKEIASTVYVCLLERRFYHDHPNQLWAHNAEYYTSVSQSINRGLRRNANTFGYRTIAFNSEELIDRKPDGVHFTELGKRKLYEIIKCKVADLQA